MRPSLETRPPTPVQPQPEPTATAPPRPEAVATKPIAYLPQPTGKVRRTKLKLVALAVALIAVVAIGLVASAFLGLISLPFPTGTSQGSTCTITGPGVCHIETLNIAGLSVTNSSYNGNPTLDIRFGVNETGTNPINITTVRFDNAPLQNGPPPPTAKNFTAFWWSTSNSLGAPTEIIGNVEFMLEVPWVQLQHESTPVIGVHTVTLVDSSGKSYAFSFKGTLNIP